MQSTTRSDVRRKLLTAAHYLAALVLLLKAIAYLDREPVAWRFIGLCVAAALTILIVTIFHHRLHARFPRIQCVVYLVEATVCMAVAYNTYLYGKLGLPIAWGVAAVILLARCLYEFRGHHRT